MATRFYFSSSGVAPIPSGPAVDAAWGRQEGFVRLPMFTTKQNTSLVIDTRNYPVAGSAKWCWYQFQSQPLAFPYSFTTSDTWRGIIGLCGETTGGTGIRLAHGARIFSRDGAALRGTMEGVPAGMDTEFPLIGSAATRIRAVNTLDNAIDTLPGDRIIFELGVFGTTPTQNDPIQMQIGDPTATADYVLTSGLTTTLVGWFELSKDVVLSDHVGGGFFELPRRKNTKERMAHKRAELDNVVLDKVLEDAMKDWTT